MTNKYFPMLFSPGRIGTLEIKNRILMTPMGSRTAGMDGMVNQRTIDYYSARAKGGVGLIIVEVSCVDAPEGRSGFYHLIVDDDKYIPGLSRLTQAIHRHGGKVAQQLQHGGRVVRSAMSGRPPVGPSAVPSPFPGWQGSVVGEMPRELTVSEIKAIVDKFGQAAARSRKAGFDGVEIHGLGLYLVASFLSPASNKRRDAYGGTPEKRARFLLEIIESAKKTAGKDFPVWVRLSIKELGIENGITMEDGIRYAQLAEEAGADAIHAHTMTWGVSLAVPPPMSMGEPPGSMMESIEQIKKAVSIPVIAVGRITPQLGEKILAENKADFIAMGKQLLTDPDLPNKAAAGKADEIRPCIGCICCLDNDPELFCAVNAQLTKEETWKITPAPRKKKVIVVGGGPAGMEAARVAALRGHDVTLYEKQSKLGGQLLNAILPPHKTNLPPLIDYLANQMKKLGVRVELGIEATKEEIEKAKPDVVIMAAGGAPFVPEITGIHGANVSLAWEVLNGKPVGQKVLVIGGELVAIETAEFLAEKGKKVTVTEIMPEMATSIKPGLRPYRMSVLAAQGATMFTGIKYQEITDHSVTFLTKEGAKLTVEVDNVVVAAGSKSCQALLHALEGKVSEIYSVGDCTKVRGIKESIADGFGVARGI